MSLQDSESKRLKTLAIKRAFRLRHQDRLRIEGRLASRAYRAAHPDRVHASKRRAYARHREEHILTNRAYRLKNSERLSATHRAYYLAHKDKLCADVMARYYADHEASLARAKELHRLHPETKQARDQRRRAHKMHAPINDLTAAQWLEIQAAYDHRCAYCQKRRKGHLTQDHILALSQGGSHTLSNVIPACRSCNSKKHTGPPLCPVQPLLLTLAPVKKKG